MTGDDRGVVAQFRDGFGFTPCAFDGRWRQLGQVDEFYRLEGPIELVDHLPNGSLAAFSQPFDEGVSVDCFPCTKFHKAVLHHTRVGLKWKTHVRCKFQFGSGMTERQCSRSGRGGERPDRDQRQLVVTEFENAIGLVVFWHSAFLARSMQ